MIGGKDRVDPAIFRRVVNAHRHVADAPEENQAVEPAEVAVPAGIARPLIGVVAGVLALALLGLVLLWPDQAPTSTADAYRGVTFASGRLAEVRQQACKSTAVDRLPDGSVPETATCVTGTVTLDGDRPVKVAVPVQVARSGLGTGDRVRLALYPAQGGEPATYSWAGYDRTRPLLVLVLLFVAVILAVARWRGLATVAGLVVAFPLLVLFVLPALRRGENAVLVSLVAAVLMVTVLLYVAHGPSVRTTVAWLGVLGGVLITVLLAWWVTAWAHLDGLSSQDDFALGRLTSGGGLTGIVLCGMVLAGLGLLNDVAIGQVLAVWELRAVAPELGPVRLFSRALAIGRDNMSSTFYTLIFAYVGATLPTLLLIDVYHQPLGQALIDGEVAEQVVRILVGGIGLVLAVPLTTLLAAVIATAARPVHPAGVTVASG